MEGSPGSALSFMAGVPWMHFSLRGFSLPDSAPARRRGLTRSTKHSSIPGIPLFISNFVSFMLCLAKLSALFMQAVVEGALGTSGAAALRRPVRARHPELQKSETRKVEKRIVVAWGKPHSLSSGRLVVGGMIQLFLWRYETHLAQAEPACCPSSHGQSSTAGLCYIASQFR